MDGQFSDLPVPHRALLWCIRAQVLELRRGVDASGPVDDMLTRLGAGTAAAALRDMVAELSRSCTRMIEVRCTCQTDLSDDEGILMAVFSATQAFEFASARLLLRRFVTSEGAEAVLVHADVITTALLQAGHSLPPVGEPMHADGRSSKTRSECRHSAAVH